MRGVFAGVLALIALQVVVQEGPSTRLAGAASWLQKATSRLLSPDVAGIPDRRAGTARPTGSSRPSGSSGGSVVSASTRR